MGNEQQPPCCYKTTPRLPSLTLDGMNPNTRVQLLTATGCSEGVCEEGGVQRFSSTSRNGYSVEKLSLKNSHKHVESLCIRIRDSENKRNPVVDVYYRPPELSLLMKLCYSRYRSLRAFRFSSCWGTSTTSTTFNLLLYWRRITASRRQSKRFLECIEENILSRVIDTVTRGM